MQTTRNEGDSSTVSTHAIAQSRVGIISTSASWDTALGLSVDVGHVCQSIDEIEFVCYRTPEVNSGADSRLSLSRMVGALREHDVRCVLVLCSGQRVDRNPGSLGRLFVVEDHVNWSGDNPLIGGQASLPGERFIDMARAYDSNLCASLWDAALEIGFSGERGIAVDSPLKQMPELPGAGEHQALISGLAQPVIAARQAGMRVGAVALLDQDSSSSDGTSVVPKGYGTEELRHFLEVAAPSYIDSVEV